MQIQEKVCLHCQEKFIPKRTDARYCSPSCKQLSYLNRKNEKDNPGSENRSESNNKHLFSETPVKSDYSPASVKLPVKTPVKLGSFTANRSSPPEVRAGVKSEISVKPKLDFTLNRFASVKKLHSKTKHSPLPRQTEKTGIKQEHVKDEVKIPDFMEEKETEWKIKKLTGMDMASLLKKWGYTYLSNVTKTNEQLKLWIKRMVDFNHREIKVKEIKEFLTLIKEHQQSFDFKYLPADYPYLGYIEDLKSKLQKIIINAEIGKNKSVPVLLTKKSRAEITYLLMDIDQ